MPKHWHPSKILITYMNIYCEHNRIVYDEHQQKKWRTNNMNNLLKQKASEFRLTQFKIFAWAEKRLYYYFRQQNWEEKKFYSLKFKNLFRKYFPNYIFASSSPVVPASDSFHPFVRNSVKFMYRSCRLSSTFIQIFSLNSNEIIFSIYQ